MLLAVLDYCLVNSGVAAVRNDCFAVLEIAFWVPHSAGVADHRWHRGVDDYVRGHVQVRNSLVGIDHCHRGPRCIAGFDIGLDRLAFAVGEFGDF